MSPSGVRRLGLVRMNPLRIPAVSLPKDNDLLPNLAFNVTDSEQFGWRDATVTDASVDLKKYTILAEIFFPHFRMHGQYEADGELLGFIPLRGEGEYNVKTDDSRFKVTMQGHAEHRKTGRHLHLDHLSFKSKFGRIHIELQNLFGNQQLSELTNSLLNQNSDLLGERAAPAVDRIFSEIYRGLLQRFFDIVPLDGLFADLPQ